MRLQPLALTLTLALALTGCGMSNAASMSGSQTLSAKGGPSLLKPKRPAQQKPAQILVKFKAQMMATDLQAFRAEFGTRNVGLIASLGVYVEEIAAGESLAAVLDAMQASPLVEYAEANGEVSIAR